MDILSEKPDTSQQIAEEGPLLKEATRDEYPIIWYDPDIDSSAKKAFKALIQANSEIALFSKFKEVLDVAQSLGSFLLIAPTEVDGEKLLQNLGVLKDTYGRRYFNFEEKAVLSSLFEKISENRIKSLRVYLFCTREDFLKTTPFNKEEEEVVIKCDIREMAEQFREEFAILWCDPNYNSDEKYRTVAEQLDIEEKNIFTDFDDLLKKLDDETRLPYHLILSGKAKTELIINRIDDLKGLLRLYIYESPPLVLRGKTRCKIEKERTLEGLVPKVIEGIRTKSVYKNTFPSFAAHFDDMDKSHINKVHYYLRGFVNFENRRQAKGDFVSLAKKIHESQKLVAFEKEYFDYDKKGILKWYAEQSPIYKVINNCLRISTSDSILYCRFLLKDMERAIRDEYQEESKVFNGVVYRGAYMTEDEFASLGRNAGKEIEMYGFLSTSRNLKTANKFLNEDVANKVLITIIIPPLPLPELDEQGFADMSKFSKFPEEEEILFNVKSRFQILEAESIKLDKNKKECRHLVLLYGAQLLRQYMTMENSKISLKFELPLKFQCYYCKSKRNLFAYTEEKGKTQMVCRGCLSPNNFVSKSIFLLPLDKQFELSEKRSLDIEVLGRMLEFEIEAKLAYAKTYRCHQCFRFGEYFAKWIDLGNGNVILNCLECFKKKQEDEGNHLLLFEGSTQMYWGSKQGKWEEIDMYWKKSEFGDFDTHKNGARVFRKAHDYDKCQEFCRTLLQSSVRKMWKEGVKILSYISLGKSCKKLAEYQKAIEYNLRALEIQRFIYGEIHSKTATSYMNLASVYESLGEDRKALEYLLKSLDLRKSIHGEAHPKIATSYNNLALVFENLGKYQEALGYLGKAIDIQKFNYGESHPQTATSYMKLASVYESLGKDRKALEYHQKALEIRKSIFGESHPETADSYNGLASTYAGLGEHTKALEYNLKALRIRKSIYRESHPETATSYNSLALVYSKLGKYKTALKYHQRALKIQRSNYKKPHPEIATSYNNLASVYESLGEYQKALDYCLDSLKLRKSIYGEFHPDTAISYNNLGLVYASLGKYKESLEYHLKALDTQKSIYREAHPEIATSYNNLALVYVSFGEHQKASEYLLEALDIQKSVYGEAHSSLAVSYNNLASVCESLGEYQAALEFDLMALGIRKSIYGETHPDTAASYNGLASVYAKLGEHQKALEYDLKALKIRRSIFMKSHPEMAVSYNSLALVYAKLGEYKKALKYHLKALEIRNFIYGESHPETADSYKNCASVYSSLGDHKTALEEILKALDTIKLIYGEAHPETAASYNTLALVYERSGKHQEALEFHLKALQIRESIHGGSHPDTATLYCNLASVHSSLGEHREALKCDLKALEIRKSIYRESHPEIATSFHQLGLVYESLGEHQKALGYLLKSLNLRKSIYMEAHPEIAASHNNLASVYESLGKFQKEFKHHLKALAIIKLVYGEAHSETAASYYNLALACESLGQYDKALKYDLKALKIQKSIYEASHPDIADSYSGLASVYDKLGMFNKALKYDLKALEILESLYEESHPEIISSYKTLGLRYAKLGEHQKALEYDLKALQMEAPIGYEISLLSNDDLVFIDSPKELVSVSEINSGENDQLPASSPTFIEVEEFSDIENCESFKTRGVSTKNYLIAHLRTYGKVSEVLGKRNPCRNDDEEEIFEPNLEKKFKQ